MIWPGLCCVAVAVAREGGGLLFGGDRVHWIMAAGLALLTWALLTWAALAETPGAADCAVTRVVDGDTLHLTCLGQRHKLRLLGFDTPEVSRPSCAAEAAAGARATAVLRALVSTGPVTALWFDGQDRYGRDLASMAIAGRDVAGVMLGSGLARPYAGGRRQGWCTGR